MMQPVLTAAAQRAADRETIERFGLSGRTLMETAGRGAADCIEKTFGPVRGRTVVCLCGKGNNGGDGFVVARLLSDRGATVRVFAMGSPQTADAAHSWQLLERLATDGDAERLQLAQCTGAGDRMRGADLYVDALLGTGLTKPLREPAAGLVAFLSERAAPVVSLDVPTGLHPDTGVPLGAAVRARLTVTMGALKPGLLIGDGPEFAGRVEVVDIGIPRHVTEKIRREYGAVWRTTDTGVAALLPRRRRTAHKYSAGAVLVVGGIPGLTGAPVMASLGAARVGAGYVTCATGHAAQAVVAAGAAEIVTVGLPWTEDRGFDPAQALAALAPHLQKAGALLVGPGLGREAGTREFVLSLLGRTTLPTVVDADALYALGSGGDFTARHGGGRWILTPHAGEFRRLSDVDATDRVGVAARTARGWNCVLALKGMPTIVAWPDGTTFISGTGGPALATAGTGDVLAGLCAGLLAQGLSPGRAAVCAVHLGGAAADSFARRNAPNSMMATDMLIELPRVLAECDSLR